MGANVFANSREISGKAAGNKTIAKMPDVCLSPPSPPAGPIPIPYPNFAMASDTTDGSKKVKIGKKEVGLKGKSKYKKSKGDEAATRSFGASVVSHTISGSVKHAAGSFDVKIEGSNVVRFGDFTTGNHSNAGLPPGPDIGGVSPGAPPDPECEELDRRNNDARDEDGGHMQDGVDRFTLTTSKFTSPDGQIEFWGATAPRRENVIEPDYQSGYRDVNRKGSMACDENSEWGQDDPRHSSVNNNMARNHAEPKLIEPHFGGGPNPTSGPAPSGGPGSLGTLKMKTFHQPEPPAQADAMPCEHCKRGICKAADCGLEIILCNDKNQPVNAGEELCKDGQPAPGRVSDDWDEQVAAENAFWGARGLG